MKKSLILLLIPLIAFSGCIGGIPGVPTGAKGGDISVSFSVDSTEIPAGNPLGLSISIENNALNPMRNVKVKITEPEGWTKVMEPTLIGDIEREGMWEGVWIYSAPSNVQVDTPYKFYAKLTFAMNTSRGVSVTLVSYDYYKRTKERSRVSTATPDTGGPIGIEFGQLGQMSYMYSGHETRIPIKVIITNRGAGKAYIGDEPTSTNLNKVMFYASGKNLNCPYDGKEIYLMKDGSVATVMCYIQIPPEEFTDIKSFSVSVRVEYNYVYDLISPTITVLSAPGGGVALEECTGTPTFSCSDFSGDVNGDGEIDILDITACLGTGCCNSTGYPNNECVPLPCNSYETRSQCETCGCSWG
ncbi:MAG: hypothetical protein DRP00_01950 [Candidatus Aenigmatarchaeota archaeon]|nr:MAG: hypothetical protein DRP00_01950 [Candidatus Aenigmarchaeota archaeon]